MAYKQKSPIIVVEGGTGAQTLTSNGVLLGNTTSAITATTAGTTGQVLTGVTGNAPTFQAPAASSITVTGDSGGALTGNSFTFTGASTGLTFAGAGTTETLGGTLAIANGGTNATSMATSTGIVKYDGTRLVTSSTANIDSSNRQTNTSQPCFEACVTSNTSNVTGDGTLYNIIYGTALFDQGSNYNTGTGVFTAPIAGRYLFLVNITPFNMSAANTQFYAQLITTARTYFQFNYAAAFTTFGASGSPGSIAIITNMAAADTAYAAFSVSGGTEIVGIFGAPTDPRSTFSAYLLC